MAVVWTERSRDDLAGATEDELDLMHAWQAVRDLRIPADVIPVRRSEFEEARDHAGTLVRTVVAEGRRIYAR